jgi:hypothetical protein
LNISVVLLGFESVTHRLVWATGDKGGGDGEQINVVQALECGLTHLMLLLVVRHAERNSAGRKRL